MSRRKLIVAVVAMEAAGPIAGVVLGSVWARRARRIIPGGVR